MSATYWFYYALNNVYMIILLTIYLDHWRISDFGRLRGHWNTRENYHARGERRKTIVGVKPSKWGSNVYTRDHT